MVIYKRKAPFQKIKIPWTKMGRVRYYLLLITKVDSPIIVKSLRMILLRMLLLRLLLLILLLLC
jgi:hypothetical protein